MYRASKLSIVLALLTLTSSVLGLSVVSSPPAGAANPSYDLDQCANGGVGNADLVCAGSAWQNGNLNRNQAHYAEGQSVPYRLTFGNLDPGQHTVVIEWDTLEKDKHAIDYITTYNRTPKPTPTPVRT